VAIADWASEQRWARSQKMP